MPATLIRVTPAAGVVIGLAIALGGCAPEPLESVASRATESGTPSGGTRPSQSAEPQTPASAPEEAPSPMASASISASLESTALRAVIDAASIVSRLERLQGIADEHGGNRAAGTAGFDASADYVEGVLEHAGYVVHRQAFSFPGSGSQAQTVSLIAERPGRDDSGVVMLGAHLDSVAAGPGINDNGSGSMTLLELAERLAGFDTPGRTVRFAFWGAEEPGRYGSGTYVDGLSPAESGRLVAYLNFDVLASPNYIRFVYDELAAAPGSAAITQLFGDHFARAGLAWEPIDLTGHADHGAFTAAGIPTGGLFSGGDAPKSEAQAALFGGTAGALADACIHRACDTIANVNPTALDEMAAAAAHALAVLAGG